MFAFLRLNSAVRAPMGMAAASSKDILVGLIDTGRFQADTYTRHKHQNPLGLLQKPGHLP